MNIVWRENLPYPELQKKFVESATNNCDQHLKSYSDLEQSYNGSYINSDLMKFTFPEYAYSSENRSEFNLQVHNPSASLANELFIRNIKSKKYKKCIFVTGAPASGKSFLMQSLYLSKVIDDDTMCFEVTITSPHIYEKIRLAKEEGLDIGIIVVNAPLELIAQNVVNRRNEIGRNVGDKLISTMLSKIPVALAQIKQTFPDLDVEIYDKKSNHDVEYVDGNKDMSVLYHGEYEEINERLDELREQYESIVGVRFEMQAVGNRSF